MKSPNAKRYLLKCYHPHGDYIDIDLIDGMPITDENLELAKKELANRNIEILSINERSEFLSDFISKYASNEHIEKIIPNEYVIIEKGFFLELRYLEKLTSPFTTATQLMYIDTPVTYHVLLSLSEKLAPDKTNLLTICNFGINASKERKKAFRNPISTLLKDHDIN
jgi:hypothetical protein